MKVLVLIGGGRSGIDLFQSLLDSHEEVLQFPDHFHFDEFWQEIKDTRDFEKIYETFIKRYKKFFDSRLNEIERHNQLGDNKNQYYLVDEKKFKEELRKFFKISDFNEYNVFKNFHLAYALSCNEDIEKKKILVIHLHHIRNIRNLTGIKFDTLMTIRDPLSSYSSLIRNWLNYNDGKNLSPYTFYFHLNRMFNGVKDISQISENFIVIKLEIYTLKTIKL